MSYGNTPQDQFNRRRWLAENLDTIQRECLDMRKELGGRMPFVAILCIPADIGIFGDKERAIYHARKHLMFPEELIDELIRIPLAEDDTFIVVVASNGFMRTTLSAQLMKREVESMGGLAITYNAAELLEDGRVEPAAGSGGMLPR